MKTISAVDLGASSVKMTLGNYDGDNLNIVNKIVFDNIPVDTPNAIYWNIFSIYNSLLFHLNKIGNDYKIESIGIDSWGATYGLLDKNKNLLEPVYHYRDERAKNALENIHKFMNKKDLFDITGCQCNLTYTLPQLFSYSVNNCQEILQIADKLLFLPDLISYFLSGEIYTEKTIASTSGILFRDQNDWANQVLNKLNIPQSLFMKPENPGKIKGKVRRTLFNKNDCYLTSVVGHDTASGVVCIPNFGRNKLYISIGTNINMGIECDEYVVNDIAYENGLKNASSFENKYLLYRDFPAFWLINRLQLDFVKEGKNYSYEEMIDLAKGVDKFVEPVDIEKETFLSPVGSMKEKINSCRENEGYELLLEDGEFILCMLSSIAEKVLFYMQCIEKAANIKINEAFAINGGVRNDLLMQMISDRLKIELNAGIPEATSIGNLFVQLYALKELSSLDEIRQVSSKSFVMKKYLPK